MLDEAMPLDEEMPLTEAIKHWAKQYSVSAVIHPEDHIFNFLVENPVFRSDARRARYYFRDGAQSARQCLDLLGKHTARRHKIELLEFAAGFGCVTRHLSKSDAITLHCCDIHQEAISFLRSELTVTAVQSSSQPEMLETPQTYDAVFALSFFSHMPIATWARWLLRLTRSTRAGGLIAFTTHGMISRRHFGYPEIPAAGFWFDASSEQKDLSTVEYGQTIVTKTFVRKVAQEIADIEILEEREGYWWGHQDLYVFRKL